MKKIIKRFSAVITAVTLMLTLFVPVSGYASSSDTFEKGDPNLIFGVLYSDAASDETFVRSVNIRTDDLLTKGAKPLANEVASKLKNLPAGRRVIDLTGFTYILSDDMQNYFFLSEASVEKLRKNTEDFFSALKDTGAELDYVIDDNESGIVCYAIENFAIQHFKEDSENIQQTIKTKGHLYEAWIKEELMRIEQLPEYQAIRPALEEAGYVFGEEYDLEYINIYPGAQEPRKSRFYEEERPEGADTTFSIFNTVFDHGIYWTKYREAVFDTIIKYYPNIEFCNYGDGLSTGKLPVYNYQGTRSAPGMTGFLSGTASSTVNYGNFKMIETNPPAEYPYDTMADTAFNQLLIEYIKNANDAIARNNEHKAMHWVGMKTWVSDGQSAYHNHYKTDYYDELVIHLGLMGCQPFLIYNQDSEDYGTDLNELRELFIQLGELTGFDDREYIIHSLNQVPSWDQRYLLTGMQANGKGIWRITPDLFTPGVSMENFLAGTTDGIKFRIGNQCIDFPEGSYIYEPENVASKYGYWVITPDATWPEEYRSLDYPLPDEPIDTDDHMPAGHEYESTETMPDPNNYLKPLIVDEDEEYTPSTDTSDKEDNTSGTVVQKPVATTLTLNPIMGKGAVTALFDGGMPADMVGHWAQDSLANMMGLGIMQGSNIGMEPDRMINKAEFLAMLTRVLGVKTTEYTGGYSDVAAGSWYADIMGTVAGGGWIEAESGMLSPETDLTRSKMCAILVNALGLTAQSGDNDFSDLYYLGDDAKNNISTIAALGLIEGYPDGTFKPNNICTRAETAVIFERLLHVIPDLFGAK